MQHHSMCSCRGGVQVTTLQQGHRNVDLSAVTAAVRAVGVFSVINRLEYICLSEEKHPVQHVFIPRVRQTGTRAESLIKSVPQPSTSSQTFTASWRYRFGTHLLIQAVPLQGQEASSALSVQAASCSSTRLMVYVWFSFHVYPFHSVPGLPSAGHL